MLYQDDVPGKDIAVGFHELYIHRRKVKKENNKKPVKVRGKIALLASATDKQIRIN